MRRLGAERGDVVAFILPNIPEFPVAFLGCAGAGLVVTTINPTYRAEEIAKQLENSGTKYVLTIGTYITGRKSFHKPNLSIWLENIFIPNFEIFINLWTFYLVLTDILNNFADVSVDFSYFNLKKDFLKKNLDLVSFYCLQDFLSINDKRTVFFYG